MGDRQSVAVSFKPTPERAGAILHTMEQAKTADYMPPRTAAEILGRLNFLLCSGAYHSCGRAATQPLVSRCCGLGRSKVNRGPTHFTTAMGSMLKFFTALFLDLPPLVIKLGVQEDPKVLVYTDASYARNKLDNKVRRKGLGIIVVDCKNGNVFRSRLDCPTWFLRQLEERDTQIAVLELLAVLCAVFTFPDILFGRQALFFIDNTQALSSAIHGYTRNLDCAPLSNLLHLSLAALQVTPWFDFVPSKANCADLPSREEGDEERAFYAKRKAKPRAMRVPSLDDLHSPSMRAIGRLAHKSFGCLKDKFDKKGKGRT